MIPSPSSDYVVNGASPDTKVFGCLFNVKVPVLVKFSDQFNVTVSKFCRSCLFSFSANCPTFFHLVQIIVHPRSEKQMVRVAAGRIIAMMQNAKIIWTSFLGKIPRNPVSQSGNGSSNGKGSVTIGLFRSGVWPTFVHFSNCYLFPKSLLKCGFRPSWHKLLYFISCIDVKEEA